MPIQHLPDAECSGQSECVAIETAGIELKMQLSVHLLAERELNEHLRQVSCWFISGRTGVSMRLRR